MRPSIKYVVTLFLVLLIGYTQVFVHLYRTDSLYSSVLKTKRVEYFHTPVMKAGEIEAADIEEGKNKGTSLKKAYSDNTIYVNGYACLPGNLFHRLKNYAAALTYLCFSFSGTADSAFHVLRL